MTTDRDGPRSNPYKPDPANCCEACAFGRGEHATFCRVEAARRRTQWITRELLANMLDELRTLEIIYEDPSTGRVLVVAPLSEAHSSGDNS